MGWSRIGQAPPYRRDVGGRVRAPVAIAVFAAAVLALGVGAREARPAGSGHVTITVLAGGNQPVFDVLVPNFERVYPNITVTVNYAPSNAVLYQLETTELAAGNGPDVLTTYPGCANLVSICVLGPAGYLAPMINAPWTKRSLPSVLSRDKYGGALLVFTPQVAPEGVFTNNALFGKLGLKVPQTFPQLLELCRKAKAAGTVAVILAANSTATRLLLFDLALNTVYGNDKNWSQERRAGTVTFSATPGWHQALQGFVDMNSAGCFEPGVTGTTIPSALAEFAQGQGLMLAELSSQKGGIDASNPQFSYSFSPFPGGALPNQTKTLLNLPASLSVNARSSTANQAAAQTFIDFIARPKQDALYAQISGGLTQYEFLHAQIPGFMSAFAPVFAAHQYASNPAGVWPNAGVAGAIDTYGLGLLTGQSSIDDVLNAMDAAWKQGP